MFEQEQISNQELTPTGREQAEEAETPLQSPLSPFPPVKFLKIHSFSKAKIFFQSFFMLMTVQPFFFASS